jgi:hypothetical protein
MMESGGESLRLSGRDCPGEQQAGSQKSQNSKHMGVQSHYRLAGTPGKQDLSGGVVRAF